MEENKNQNKADFMKETIKQRPLNRRKLIRRTLITAAMAVIFGMVACFTFLLLEPVISNRLYPEEEPETIVFEEETEEDEILPEDMIADESEMQPESTEPAVLEDEQIEQVLSEMKLGTEDYLSLINEMSKKARELQKSVVTVVGVTSDVSWLDNVYENEGVVSGVVVADNGKELLVLANIRSIKDAQTLKVIFWDDAECEAVIKKKDNNTGFAIISVAKSVMKDSTLYAATPIELGSSVGSGVAGIPVIALGRPVGTEGSVCYGNVTSTGNAIELPDSAYKYLTTDIYGSTTASGIIVNLKGQLVGMIDTSYNPSDMKNMISAVGISELKKTIESLSNDREIPYFGVHGMDVTREANEEMEVPFGAYILETDMDSPAMAAGIQSGDIIVGMDEKEIARYTELLDILLAYRPEDTVKVRLMRQGPDGYMEMEVEAVLSLKNE